MAGCVEQKPWHRIGCALAVLQGLSAFDAQWSPVRHHYIGNSEL